MSNEETKDCARLPVVAYVHPLYLKPNALGFDASACRLAAAQVGLCLADDAQARLAEKDARIAQLAAHARGKNKALANALKEIERLKTISDNYCALLMDANQKLQSAPAERGVVLPALKVVEQAWGYDEGGNYAEGFAEGYNDAIDDVQRLNPAPATADSDVREVK